jgi:hypothetical protein
MTSSPPPSDRAARVAALTGRRAGTPHPFSVTAADGGGKFTPEGAPLRYPGNTFLCHVDRASAAFAALTEMQRQMMASPWASHFAFLPPASFHMTVFRGVAGNPLAFEGWPDYLPTGTSLGGVTRAFLARLDGQPGASGVRVRADRCDLGTSIAVVPQDPASGRALADVRDVLRRATGLDREDHESYVFHVSLAYLVRWLDEVSAHAYLDALDAVFAAHRAALDGIELGPVEVCEFETMLAFRPVAHFGPEGLRGVDDGG